MFREHRKSVEQRKKKKLCRYFTRGAADCMQVRRGYAHLYGCFGRSGVELPQKEASAVNQRNTALTVSVTKRLLNGQASIGPRSKVNTTAMYVEMDIYTQPLRSSVSPDRGPPRHNAQKLV